MNREAFEDMCTGEAGEWILQLIDRVKDAIYDAEQRLTEPGSPTQLTAWKFYRELQVILGVNE